MIEKITRRGALAALVGLVGVVSSVGYLALRGNSTEQSLRVLAANVSHTRQKKTRRYKTENLRNDTDDILLARMIFGEARDCADQEKIAVAYTAINRIDDGKRQNGTTLKEVLLAPDQYSCFNRRDKNRTKLMDPDKYGKKEFEHCLLLARVLMAKKYKDPTNGATHYHAAYARPLWSLSPSMKKIGRIETPEGKSAHIFYREEINHAEKNTWRTRKKRR